MDEVLSYLFFKLIPLAIVIYILYFVMKAAVKSAIDEKLEEIKKVLSKENNYTQNK